MAVMRAPTVSHNCAMCDKSVAAAEWGCVSCEFASPSEAEDPGVPDRRG